MYPLDTAYVNTVSKFDSYNLDEVLRPVLEGFIVTIHEGVGDQKRPWGWTPCSAQARVHCDLKPERWALIAMITCHC